MLPTDITDILRDWRIIVIDDEEDSLEVAEIILLEYGASLHTASNGQDALAIVHDVMPHFIISDISMPIMDGWGFISALKSDRATAHIPVIALTAHAMKGDRERAIGAGFHNYLSKPLTADTFIHDLLNLLTDIPEFADRLSV